MAAPPAIGRAEISNYDVVRHWFHAAADLLGLDDDIRAVMLSAYREVQVQIPVRRIDGRIHVYAGYRVQHNGARPLQGRHPLPPRCRPRRDPCPGRADDDDRLGTIMRRAYREVMARTRSQDEPPLRVAAYQVGIERVVEAARLRGYI